MKIILGVPNAKVGKEIWPGIAVGICGLHGEFNDSGRHNHKLCSHSTSGYRGILYSQRNAHRGTWHGADDRNANQINRVMSDQRHPSTIEQ